MKIATIQTYIARVPLGTGRFYSSQAAFGQRKSLLVRIETDEGHVGWGEGGQFGPGEPVASCIEHVYKPALLGQDPTVPVRHWERLYAEHRDYGQKSVYIEALSAIDIALWDITGQVLGRPVHQLLGGSLRDSVPAYATGCYYRGETPFDEKQDLAPLAAEARKYVDAGFRTLKMKVGLWSVPGDARRVATVREAIGDDVTLLVDANHAYHSATAIRMGRHLEAHGVAMMEEPVIPEDRDGYRAVRQALDLAVAGGECEYTRYGFRDLIAGGCVDIAQPDVCICGGLSEMGKIVAMASAYNLPVVPHVWGSGIALAAAMHVLATLPLAPFTANPVPGQSEPIVEFDRNVNPLRDELLEKRFELVDGRVAVPQGPGLGIKVNEETLARFTRPA